MEKEQKEILQRIYGGLVGVLDEDKADLEILLRSERGYVLLDFLLMFGVKLDITAKGISVKMDEESTNALKEDLKLIGVDIKKGLKENLDYSSFVVGLFHWHGRISLRFSSKGLVVLSCYNESYEALQLLPEGVITERNVEGKKAGYVWKALENRKGGQELIKILKGNIPREYERSCREIRDLIELDKIIMHKFITKEEQTEQLVPLYMKYYGLTYKIDKMDYEFAGIIKEKLNKLTINKY